MIDKVPSPYVDSRVAQLNRYTTVAAMHVVPGLKNVVAVCLLGAMPFLVARAEVLTCESETHSADKLLVAIPASSYQSFVRLIEGSDVVPGKERFKYIGGIDSESAISWGLNNETHTIGIYVDYVKKSQRFEFWIQTCGPNASWQPYWRALLSRVRKFPGAQLTQVPIGGKDG